MKRNQVRSGGKEVKKRGVRVINLENRASAKVLVGREGVGGQGCHASQSRAVAHLSQVDRCWPKGALPTQVD